MYGHQQNGAHSSVSTTILSSSESEDKSATESAEAGEDVIIFPCLQCLFCATDTGSLLLHLASEHSIAGEVHSFVCVYCGRILRHTPSLKEIKSHLTRLHPGQKESLDLRTDRLHVDELGKFECPKCHDKLNTVEDLVGHDRLHLSQGDVKILKRENLMADAMYLPTKCALTDCVVEQKEFGIKSTTDGLPMKFKQFKGAKVNMGQQRACPFICGECGKRFKTGRFLKIHMTAHTGEKNVSHTGEHLFKCEECGKGFTTISYVNTHMMAHSGERPFKCDVCGKGFSQTSNLRTHVNLHKGERPFKCEICGKGFNQGSYLRTHKLLHTGERPFKCEICGKGFSQTNNLRSHMFVHTGERPFKCEECGKGFLQANRLKTHMFLHTGECHFKCENCGKGFATIVRLRTHMAVHSAERPFKCGECGKGFNQNSHLKTHMAVHTSARPFVCEKCGKEFSIASNLRSHMLLHADERRFKCEECGRGFNRPGCLRTHMFLHTSVGNAKRDFSKPIV